MTTKLLLAGALIALLALPAAAQNAPQGTPTRIRGTVEKLDGQTLTVKSRDGQQLTIALAPNFTVSYLVKKSLADIKAGDFVASTSTKGTDGKNHAVEVRIFPEALRGTGEGQFAWDLMPDSLMTNATVSGITAAPQGQTLKVTYKGGRVGNRRRTRYADLRLWVGRCEPAETRRRYLHRRAEKARRQSLRGARDSREGWGQAADVICYGSGRSRRAALHRL